MKKIHLLLIFLLNIVLTASSFAQDVKYTTTALNVRRGPSTNYGIIGTVPAGTVVTINDYSYHDQEWLQVIYNGQTGYISTKYLSSQKVLTSKTKTSNYSWSSGNNGGRGSNGYYTNVDGQRVARPYYSNTPPAGATAICRDGTYSDSQHRRGTCSHHGGVKVWL